MKAIIMEYRTLLSEPETVITPEYYEQYQKRIDAHGGCTECRGWITKGGRHIFIGDDSSGGGKKSGKRVDKSGGSGIIESERRCFI
mgnify:CR=1 FL=1